MQRVQDQVKKNQQNDITLAAIDLGSNSFHLIIAKIEHNEFRPIERIGEKIQLARGLENGCLNDESIERGLACLKGFKQVIDAVKPDIVRIVGTNTLRAAKNAKTFNKKAQQILGQSIEIIAGREEARLVYLGVAHTLSDDDQSRLVIDIGGGSTEFVIGQRFETKQLESLHMGCVSYSTRFFNDGKITEKRFNSAHQSAMRELLNIRSAFTPKYWNGCIGSSGTFKAINAIIEENRWGSDEISIDHLRKLKSLLLSYTHIDEIDIAGLKENRRSVIVAGLAIALAAFDTLKIKTMRFSSGALREGVIYDTIGRLAHEDVRERTVSALVSRYSLNVEKTHRITERCQHLFTYVDKAWGLSKVDLQHIIWGIELHEIGLAIAHTQFHRHGHYMLANGDLPGFSRIDQDIVALLVRSHRRKVPLTLIKETSIHDPEHILKLVVILRLAILFKYVEQIEDLPVIKAKNKDQTLCIFINKSWQQQNPLIAAELAEEQHYFSNVGFILELKEK